MLSQWKKILLVVVFWQCLFCGQIFAAVDISDVPLDAKSYAAPANIMFVLDDSGSMDWETMTSESSGLFSGQRYVFDNPGDNIYSNSYVLSDEQRTYWKSQWYGYNRMYYNPSVSYSPWPELDDADPDNPRSHPNVSGVTFNLSSTYLQFLTLPEGAAIIIADDNDSSTFSVLAGSWYESGASPEYNGTSKYSWDASGRVRWTLDVPEADTYQVWAWWSSGAGWDRDTSAKYTVSDASGTTEYIKNQTANYGQWSLLGNHYFAAGETYVDMQHGTGGGAASADAIKIIQGGTSLIDIPRSHYYVYSDSEDRPYLVTIDGGVINYYAVSVTGSGSTERLDSLELDSTPPADVVTTRTYAEERQNFANWYSFYRRRELTATAAVSTVISNMSGVQIGISSINDRINQEVVKIKVGGVDQTDTLLSALYGLVLYGNGTPLRRGLEDVGQYFHQDDGNTGGIGACPYWAAEDGGECQQSFAIVMTDGYWNGGDPSVVNEDGDNGLPYADTYYRTLGDVAMKYWERDLSSSLSDLVPTSTADTANWQHLVTYGVSFGVTGSLNPDAYDLTSSPPPDIPWPNPAYGDAYKIDDLYHASVNGHGTFLSAGDPVELVESLLAIMENIEDRLGSASSVSVNGDQLYKEIDDNTYIFQSKYDTVGWVGDLRAYKVDSTTGDIDLSDPTWSAAEVWDDYDWTSRWDERAIITFNGTYGVPFRYDSLTSTQQALLNADSTEAGKVLNYIRGDGSNEESGSDSGPYRDRTSRLGDIVHSSPVYNEGLLFAGANDGMLHVFIAQGDDAGKELFSYVPSQVIPNLSLLTDPSYAHKYYVDLTPTVEEIKISGIKKTLLVGGMKAGGIGYFALDITDLTAYDTSTGSYSVSTYTETELANRVMWEFPGLSTSADDLADIGYSFSNSYLVKSNNSSYPWVVIMGNGYNSPDGQSVLFILNPADGTVIKKIELGGGPDNGLATPSVIDVDGDNKVDYIYAGDLLGQLWKVDVSSSSISDWEVAYKSGGAGVPLFSAVGPSGLDQPITSMPDVMYHPAKDGYLVLFGTGRYLGDSDLSDTSTQTVYGVWDYGDDSDDSEYLGYVERPAVTVSNLSSRSTLLEQTAEIDNYFYDPDGDGEGTYLRIMSDNDITWKTESDSDSDWDDPSDSEDNNIGWYFDLPIEGERVVSRMLIRENRAIYISFIPQVTACSASGKSILNEVDAKDGSRLSSPVFDINGDGVIDENDTVEIGGNSFVVSGLMMDGEGQAPAILSLGTEEIKYISNTSGSIETYREKGIRLGVSSWREF